MSGCRSDAGVNPWFLNPQVVELYDSLYAHRHWDVDVYRLVCRGVRGNVLVVGCGTGRILIPLLQDGSLVTGVDISPAMIERLKSRASAEGVRADVVLEDMRSFRLGRRFDRILVPFNTLLYNLTAADLLEALRSFRSHLTDRGEVWTDFFRLSESRASAGSGEPCLAADFWHGRSRLRLYESKSRPVRTRQLFCRATFRSVLEDGSEAELVSEEKRLRLLTVDELRRCSKRAGFAACDIAGRDFALAGREDPDRAFARIRA